VLDSSASGINTVEREGISIAHPAKFIMIGSGNPAVSNAGGFLGVGRVVRGCLGCNGLPNSPVIWVHWASSAWCAMYYLWSVESELFLQIEAGMHGRLLTMVCVLRVCRRASSGHSCWIALACLSTCALSRMLLPGPSWCWTGE
jgi:hypothetical protein